MQTVHRQQGGFTLIELLIAMTVSAVIAVLAYQAVNQVVVVKAQTDSSVSRFEQIQRAVWWLEQDFTQLAPRSVTDENGAKLSAYQFDPYYGAQMTRIAEYPSPYGISGLVRVGYVLEDDTLYRVIWQVLDRAPDTQPEKLPVLERVKRFEVRQLDKNNQWKTSWPSDPTKVSIELPRMIDILIELDDMGEIRRLLPGVDGMPIIAPTQAPGNGSGGTGSTPATGS